MEMSNDLKLKYHFRKLVNGYSENNLFSFSPSDKALPMVSREMHLPRNNIILCMLPLETYHENYPSCKGYIQYSLPTFSP